VAHGSISQLGLAHNIVATFVAGGLLPLANKAK